MESLVEFVIIDQNSDLGQQLQLDGTRDVAGAAVDQRQDDEHGLGIPVLGADLMASICGGGPFFPAPGQGRLENGRGLD